MTNQQILVKAIQKAIDGGYYKFASGLFGKPEFVVLPPDKFGQIKVHVKDWPNEYQSAEAIIFNHDFAKALWGKLPHGYSVYNTITGKRMYDREQPTWEHHLQQMVIAEDPIKYLADNL